MGFPDMQNAVVLVVDRYSLDVHLATLTAGVKYPVHYDKGTKNIYYTKEFYSILADLANVQLDTLVFFYKRRINEPPEERGFLGEWRATTLPNTSIVAYEDRTNPLVYGQMQILAGCPFCASPVSRLANETPHCGDCGSDLNNSHILPLRFLIHQAHVFSRYLDDNTAYIDVTDHGRLSTLIFRKVYGAGRERSVNPILPEEAVKLQRLLQRVHQQQRNAPIPTQIGVSPTNVHGMQGIISIFDYLDFRRQYPLKRGNQLVSGHLYDMQGELVYETVLEFWIIRELVQHPVALLQTFDIPQSETLEWFANQILFGIGGEKSDTLILMRNTEGKRCRAVVIELKKGTIDQEACEQVKRYAYWIAQLVTANAEASNPFVITPIVIGFRKSQNLQLFSSYHFYIQYQTHSQRIQVEAPRIYRYEVDTTRNTLHLRRI